MSKSVYFASLLVIAIFATTALAGPPWTSCAAVKPGTDLFDVYFGHDEVTLTPEAQALVNDAAGLITRCGITRVSLFGHGDASEVSSRAKIGKTRAETVKAGLIAKGVAASKISIQDLGSSQPAPISFLNQKVTIQYPVR